VNKSTIAIYQHMFLTNKLQPETQAHAHISKLLDNNQLLLACKAARTFNADVKEKFGKTATDALLKSLISYMNGGGRYCPK